MTTAQAAVIHKIDRNSANKAKLDSLAAGLSQSPPNPRPPAAPGLAGVLLAAVTDTTCYGVALFDTVGHANAAMNVYTSFWKIGVNTAAEVHVPVVASTTNPLARMVWVPQPLPIGTHVSGLFGHLYRALSGAFRRTVRPRPPATPADDRTSQAPLAGTH
jgi:hypothetical protein